MPEPGDGGKAPEPGAEPGGGAVGEEQGRRVPDGQAARHDGRAGERGELPHLSRLGHHGTLERAQAIAGHESPRTTQLYDRTSDDITVEDIERIRI